MRIGTLFSGIGAPEQAAARVWQDHKIAFACEYDKFARQSYKAIYDIADEHFHTDVRQMDGTQYKGKVDVLVWGFPCTSYSIAGLRKGMDDEKTGDLFHQGLRILKQCKPKYTIIENVKGLLSIDNNVSTTDDDLLELRKEIVKRVISLFIRHNRGNSRWMLMSINNDSSFEDYFEVFDSLAQTNLGWENNPNSGNDIKLWVFNSPNF